MPKFAARQASAVRIGRWTNAPHGSRSDGQTHDDPRRRGPLEAALTVFARYGYAKTSMDEIARTAQVSRQGLYLHFATKEELFRVAVRNALERSLNAPSSP